MGAPGGAGVGRRAPKGNRPPGRQARKPVPDFRRPHQDSRLRPREADSAGDAGRSRRRDGIGPERAGSDRRDGGLHVARADRGRRTRPAVGRFLAGHRPLRAPRARAPVPAPDRPGDADGDRQRDASGSFAAPAGDPAGRRPDRPPLPREAPGGALSVRAGARGGARGRSRRRQRGRRAAGGRGEEPVPGPLVLYRRGFEPLLRPRGRGQDALEKAARAEASRRHRSFRRGQDVVCACGRDRGAAGGLGRDRGHAGERAPPRPRARVGAAARERSRGAPQTRGLRGRRNGLRADLALAEVPRGRSSRRRPVRGALHPQPGGDAGAVRELLGRIALDADVHVLLSMRDDFLFGCHGHEAARSRLRLHHAARPETREGLRRALVEPAKTRLPLRGRRPRGRDGRRRSKGSAVRCRSWRSRLRACGRSASGRRSS